MFFVLFSYHLCLSVQAAREARQEGEAAKKLGKKVLVQIEIEIEMDFF